MKRRTIILTALLAAAGCGGGDARRGGTEPRPPVSDAYLAKAEAACLKFLRFPGSDAIGNSRKAHLQRLDWMERHVRSAAPAEPAPDDVFREKLYAPVEEMLGTIREAERSLRAGERIGAIPDDVRRAHDDFMQGYIDAAQDLKLERCAQQQIEIDELTTRFFKDVEEVCDETARRFRRSTRIGESARSRVAFARRFRRLVNEYKAVDPPPTLEPLWKEGVAGVDAMADKLDQLVTVYRKAVQNGVASVSPRQLEQALRDPEPLMEASARRARRAFRELRLRDCARQY